MKVVVLDDVARHILHQGDAARRRLAGCFADGPQPRRVLKPPGDVIVVHPLVRILCVHAERTGCIIGRHAAVNGVATGPIHRQVIGAGIGRRQQRRDVVAVRLVVHPADRVAGGLARGVLDRQPGLEDARKLDQPEQEQQQEREHQRELDEPLAAVPAPSKMRFQPLSHRTPRLSAPARATARVAPTFRTVIS